MCVLALVLGGYLLRPPFDASRSPACRVGLMASRRWFGCLLLSSLPFLVLCILLKSLLSCLAELISPCGCHFHRGFTCSPADKLALQFVLSCFGLCGLTHRYKFFGQGWRMTGLSTDEAPAASHVRHPGPTVPHPNKKGWGRRVCKYFVYHIPHSPLRGAYCREPDIWYQV